MSKVLKVLNCIINVVFYPILAAILAVLILFLCGIKPYITMSGSMEPAIHTGSLCFVDTNAEYAEISVDDIVAFRLATGGLVTHRVIAVNEEGLETKGDANDISDGISTTEANFYGKTLFSLPYVGYAVKYMQQPATIAIIVIILIASIAISAVESSEKKKELERALAKQQEEFEKLHAEHQATQEQDEQNA